LDSWHQAYENELSASLHGKRENGLLFLKQELNKDKGWPASSLRLARPACLSRQVVLPPLYRQPLLPEDTFSYSFESALNTWKNVGAPRCRSVLRRNISATAASSLLLAAAAVFFRL